MDVLESTKVVKALCCIFQMHILMTSSGDFNTCDLRTLTWCKDIVPGKYIDRETLLLGCGSGFWRAVLFHCRTPERTLKSSPTCILFMASRSWSSWWAELSASRRISVSFISLSLSSFRNCMTVSASLSVHSEILGDLKKYWAINSRTWILNMFTQMESFNVLVSLRFCLAPVMRSMEYNNQNLSQPAPKGGWGEYLGS